MCDALDSTPYYELFQRIPDPVNAENQPEVEQEVTIDDQQKRDLSQRYSMAFMG